MCDPTHRPRTWGFRFSATDAVVIAVCAAAALLLRGEGNPLWWLSLVVVGHFFLFCNLVRIRRSFELVWAAAFLVNCALWLLLGELGALPVLASQLPLTAWVVLMEVRSNRYHGILARRLNPRLDAYLARNVLNSLTH
jgi:hypothetical protein